MIQLNSILNQRDIELSILKQKVIAKAISTGNKRVGRNGVTVQQLNKLNTIIKKINKLVVELNRDESDSKAYEFLDEIRFDLEDFRLRQENEQIKNSR